MRARGSREEKELHLKVKAAEQGCAEIYTNGSLSASMSPVVGEGDADHCGGAGGGGLLKASCIAHRSCPSESKSRMKL